MCSPTKLESRDLNLSSHGGGGPVPRATGRSDPSTMTLLRGRRRCCTTACASTTPSAATCMWFSRPAASSPTSSPPAANPPLLVRPIRLPQDLRRQHVPVHEPASLVQGRQGESVLGAQRHRPTTRLPAPDYAVQFATVVFCVVGGHPLGPRPGLCLPERPVLLVCR
jgi:hypothetical protein